LNVAKATKRGKKGVHALFFFYTVFSLLSFGLAVPAECSTFFSSSSAEMPYSLASAIRLEVLGSEVPVSLN